MDTPVRYWVNPPAFAPNSAAWSGVCSRSAPMPTTTTHPHLGQTRRPDAHDLAGHQLERRRGRHQNFHNAAAFLFRHARRHHIGIHADNAL